jgi:ppGpp synthetase/RelA/SpoT-type nucleotidyltranferase
VGLIEEFTDRYSKEYDFYEQAARLVAQILERDLRSSGVRCIVSYRAKDVARLEEKVRSRAPEKRYKKISDISSDIVDLAGVRVALYFPGEQDQVESLIVQLFNQLEDKKTFPEGDAANPDKRFSGYSAVHYRVQLREDSLSDLDKRYAKARVEIQVASVLMHAWSEVQHDLVYKQLGGDLSDQERAILDQLNGLVIAGEISLQMLQQAGENRVASNGREFRNHYELAAHLLSHANGLFSKPVGDTGLGRVDRLFNLIMEAHKTTPADLAPYLNSLHGELQRRPLAEQVIDALLSDDPSLYGKYEAMLEGQRSARDGRPSREELEAAHAMQKFLESWVNLEILLNDLARPLRSKPPRSTNLPVSQLLRVVSLRPGMKEEIEHLQRLRHVIVHGARGNRGYNFAGAAQRTDEIIAEIKAGGHMGNPVK